MFAKNTILSAVAASSLLLLSATAAVAAPVSAGTPVIQETCRATLNLSPADTAFQACAFSLADTLQQTAAAPGAEHASSVGFTNASYSAKPSTRAAQENAACAKVGYEAGKPGYASCVANLDTALTNAYMLNH